MSEPEPEGGGRRSSPLDFASLGFEIVAPVVLFLFAGYLLDGWVDSQPWFLLGGDLYTAYTFIAVPAAVFAV